MFLVVLKQIGRAIRRFFCAIGRFFKFLVKRIAKFFRTRRMKKKIKKNNADVKRLYGQIGEGYYNAHSQSAEEGLSEFCDAVTADLAANDGYHQDIDALKERFTQEKAAAKEKAKARRASDKAKSAAEKERARRIKAGEDVSDYDAVEPTPVPEKTKKQISVSPKKAEPEPEPAPAPAPEPISAPEPIPEPFTIPEPKPVLEVTPAPAPAPEPMNASEAPVISDSETAEAVQ